MSKIKLSHSPMAMYMICEAIGSDRDINLKPDENGMHDISLTVNGQEINFERFISNLQKSYNDSVKSCASNIISSKYDQIINRIQNIQEELESQYEDLFNEKYER